MSDFGLVHIYTGEGKGKTTAAIGAGIRAVGHGYRVYMIQFLKGGSEFPEYGEVRAIKAFKNFTIEQFGLSHFVIPGKASDEDLMIISRALKRAQEISSSGEYDLVILDEINIAYKLGLLPLEDLLALLKNKASQTELIMTGRGAPSELLERADLVSQIESVKHPYNSGTKARKGIEY
ncbi:MAG: cob(I)yrinic acid a,c-diamide adenosyltransferase [Candidatus Aerophobetes bacterium]|nr:cob(I)yrinic acid a,c-diamide adenosyltransferase [Candidatus Aerophobetes bacterium]